MKAFRLARQLAQKEVAAAVGITRQTLRLIEHFDYNPSLKLCLRICYVLGTTLDETFWVDEDQWEAEN
ncbi:hypothetical protein FD02_GL001605 [Lacticaseibacillus nasuensis JCM 17158]|uniref:HTH cro/C1-type domain-containing protein n=1 Tax=Lacticaseibacillus nasuensis JCM 17158 TaxID=1291734 RepID=A0A0R1JN53_9LACO|nr:hypothetical protein FD02_GL001605 [Lacticaseibacillus nasuensis JCM 17158]